MADRGVGTFVVQVVNFLKPRRGGFAGDPRCAFKLRAESTVHCVGLTEDDGALGIGYLTGGWF